MKKLICVGIAISLSIASTCEAIKFVKGHPGHMSRLKAYAQSVGVNPKNIPAVIDATVGKTFKTHDEARIYIETINSKMFPAESKTVFSKEEIDLSAMPKALASKIEVKRTEIEREEKARATERTKAATRIQAIARGRRDRARATTAAQQAAGGGAAGSGAGTGAASGAGTGGGALPPPPTSAPPARSTAPTPGAGGQLGPASPARRGAWVAGAPIPAGSPLRQQQAAGGGSAATAAGGSGGSAAVAAGGSSSAQPALSPSIKALRSEADTVQSGTPKTIGGITYNVRVRVTGESGSRSSYKAQQVQGGGTLGSSEINILKSPLQGVYPPTLMGRDLLLKSFTDHNDNGGGGTIKINTADPYNIRVVE